MEAELICVWEKGLAYAAQVCGRTGTSIVARLVKLGRIRHDWPFYRNEVNRSIYCTEDQVRQVNEGMGLPHEALPDPTEVARFTARNEASRRESLREAADRVLSINRIQYADLVPEPPTANEFIIGINRCRVGEEPEGYIVKHVKARDSGESLSRIDMPPFAKYKLENQNMENNLIDNRNAVSTVTIEQGDQKDVKTFIYGKPAGDVTDDQIYQNIAKLEQEIAALGKIENKPKKLTAKIEALRKDIQRLVDFVDSREDK